MNFLLIYPSPGVLGGIETLIARLSRWLIGNGHRVTLLAEKGGQWTTILPEEVRCVVLEKRFRELHYYFHAKRVLKDFTISPPDVIKSFDIPSSWIACQLATLAGNNCKVLAGIYNPCVFKWYYSTKSLPFWDDKVFCVKNFLKNIPANARIFCSVDQIEELEEVHHHKGVLWPLPIDSVEFDPAVRRPRPGKIVSVGRLSPMKEYNLSMIDVISSLIQRGHDVRWFVYGDGEYASAMRARIKERKLESVISMEGTIPYRLLWKALEDAYVFVGTGTSSLEAALFRVPSVIPVAYDQDGLSYGPIYRLPPGSIGPSKNRPEFSKTADEIERILKLSPTEYRTESELVFRYVEDHVMARSMGRFMELVTQCGGVTPSRSLYLANYISWFLRKAIKRRSNAGGNHHPEGPV